MLIILAAAAIASRRYLLERSGGTVECALRLPANAGRGVSACFPTSTTHCAGTARSACCSARAHLPPARAQRDLPPSRGPVEAVALGTERIVVEVAVSDASGADAGEHVELAMTDQALTGFLAWLEASPPGSHLGDFS